FKPQRICEIGIVLPLLGTINMTVALAPSFLQYAPTNPNLGLPVFTTALLRNGLQGKGDDAVGFWGLTSIYTSLNPWNQTGDYPPLNATNWQPFQIAGS